MSSLSCSLQPKRVWALLMLRDSNPWSGFMKVFKIFAVALACVLNTVLGLCEWELGTLDVEQLAFGLAVTVWGHMLDGVLVYSKSSLIRTHKVQEAFTISEGIDWLFLAELIENTLENTLQMNFSQSKGSKESTAKCGKNLSYRQGIEPRISGFSHTSALATPVL